MENALTASQNKIDAVVASNDGTAGGAVELAASRVSPARWRSPAPGRRPRRDPSVSGRNPDRDRLQAPQKLIATEAAKLTVQNVVLEKPAFNAKLDNGKKQVESLLLTRSPSPG